MPDEKLILKVCLKCGFGFVEPESVAGKGWETCTGPPFDPGGAAKHSPEPFIDTELLRMPAVPVVREKSEKRKNLIGDPDCWHCGHPVVDHQAGLGGCDHKGCDCRLTSAEAISDPSRQRVKREPGAPWEKPEPPKGT